MSKLSNEDRLDAFFSTLSSELTDQICSGPKRAAVDRQSVRARKKAAYVRPHLQDVALANFSAINDSLRDFHVSIDDEILVNARHYILVVLERYTSSFNELCIQEPLDESFLYDNWRFGPGASNGIKGTHTVEKIVQDMTCTAQCEPMLQRLRRLNPYFRLNDETNGRLGTSVVVGSRMTTVPKNEDTVRTIAIEPSGNMALQLAAGRYLEGALRYIGLDISTQQPKNKALAFSGSISNSLATIDLKSASDLISIDLVRSLMPPSWFQLLMKLRSPVTSFPDGTSIELNMISTMGNGFTFPLMTLLISSLIYGFRAANGGPTLFIDWSSTAVFGDDIIIPSHEYHRFCKVLESAGFIVNHDKSYSDGPFRESCGGDYYEGTDITPFYVKTLAEPSNVYVAINQVLEWGSRHNIMLHRTLSYLFSLLDEVFLVPEWHNPDQGVLSAQCPQRYKYLSVKPRQLRVRNNPYEMMLAVGGYVTASESDLFYTPRSARNRMCVRRARLPKGYLDGWAADRRSKSSSSWISMVLDILM